MKRYNKRQVMKDAHRLYNNDFQRRGRSWSECLRAAWSWERDAVKVLEESWKAHNERKEAKTNENWYKGIDSETLSYAMGYGRGNNFYCGD